MSVSQHVRQKGLRLVHAGRVRAVTANRTFVVERDTGRHLVAVAPDSWACDCDAYVTHCSHVEAVRLMIGGEPIEQAPKQPKPAAPPPGGGRLYTGSWRRLAAYERAGLVPVRTSVGLPKWLPDTRARSYDYLPELAPTGGLFHVDDAAEFAARYRERLDSIGVDRIEQRLQALAGRHDGRPLVLLCFEADPADCHRGDFADWWLERTGEVVPEHRATR